MRVAGVALVLRLGPESGDAAPLAVCVKVQVQADGVVDAAHKTHAGVRLLFYDAASLRHPHYSIDAGFGQASTV